MDWMLAPIITYSLTGGGVETHYRPEHHVPGLRMYENVDKLAAHTVSDFFGGSDKDKEELERKLIAYGNAIKKGAAIEQKNAVGDRVVIDTYTRLKSFYSNKILWDYQNYGLVDYLRTKNQTETGFTPTQPKLDTDLPNPEPSGEKPKNLRGPWPQGYTKDWAANTFGPRWGIENPLVDGKHQPLYFNQLPKEYQEAITTWLRELGPVAFRLYKKDEFWELNASQKANVIKALGHTPILDTAAPEARMREALRTIESKPLPTEKEIRRIAEGR